MKEAIEKALNIIHSGDELMILGCEDTISKAISIAEIVKRQSG